MELLLLVGRNDWLLLWVTQPRLNKLCGKGATGFDEEGARAHGWITYFQIENLIRRGFGPESFKRWLQRAAHDRLRQTPRSVVGAGAPPLFRRLKDRRAGGNFVLLRRAALIHNRI